MPVDRSVPETTRATKPRKRATCTLSVPLSPDLRAALEAIARQYDVPLARLAREAMTIGLRAIIARSDAYNHRAFGADHS